MLAQTLREWKCESGSTAPLLFKHNHLENRIYMYTSQPGYFIGYRGELFRKYEKILKDRIGASVTALLVEANWETL